MSTDSRSAAVINTSGPPETSLSQLSKTYGYIWAEWLYAYDKDIFMVEVYNECKAIGACVDSTKKAANLLLLRNKVKDSKKSWVEGILDFIDFESQFLAGGVPPLDVLDDAEDYRALAVLDAAYQHGAYRGTCVTASGAEWIGKLGEFCTATVHQGFKWLRLSGGLDDWELPTLGESWCKGAAMWGLVSILIAVDAAGPDPGNDAALGRIHVVFGAHHFAGVHWLKYRGAHPHKWWNSELRGRAPSEVSIRTFGDKHGWPKLMIDILCRGANHVNSWKNQDFNPVHQERTRGLLIWDHTPRLKARVAEVADELVQLVDDITDSEAEEILSRGASWIATQTVMWRGRGDRNDRLLETNVIGAVLGVLRETRTHVSNELVDRVMAWTRGRTSHLSQEMQDLFLSKLLRSMKIRGRVPGAVGSFSSQGAGLSRFLDGWWDVATWACVLAHPAGGKEIPIEMQEPNVRYFNGWTTKRRIVGTDIPAKPDEGGGCPVCIGSSIFEGAVDNSPSCEARVALMWGTVLYHNSGLGSPDDTNLGCGLPKS